MEPIICRVPFCSGGPFLFALLEQIQALLRHLHLVLSIVYYSVWNKRERERESGQRKEWRLSASALGFALAFAFAFICVCEMEMSLIVV